MIRRLIGTAMLLSIALTAIPSLPARAQDSDQPLISGRFYPQASGRAGLGYAVTDDSSAAFYAEFTRLGGPATVGYPISKRFLYGGKDTQVFQRLILQSSAGSVTLLPTFDVLSAEGKDQFLTDQHGVPAPEDLSGIDPLGVLETSPSIKAAYNGVADPVAIHGLPTSRVVDFGTYRSLRTQRALIREDNGVAAIASAGEIAKSAGIFPSSAFQPQTLAQAAADQSSAPGGPAVSSPGPEPIGGQAQRDPLKVSAVASTMSPAPGVPFRVSVRVADSGGRPLTGALVIIILHYPLKDENSAYTVDGVYTAPPTDENGATSVMATVDTAIPSGVVFTMEVSAVYPPSAGRVEIDLTAG